jgi:hypothetical protein
MEVENHATIFAKRGTSGKPEKNLTFMKKFFSEAICAVERLCDRPPSRMPMACHDTGGGVLGGDIPGLAAWKSLAHFKESSVPLSKKSIYLPPIFSFTTVEKVR